MISTMIPSIGTYETPIQFRLIQYIMMSLFNSMSSYEPNTLDYFARVRNCAFTVAASEYKRHTIPTMSFPMEVERNITVLRMLCQSGRWVCEGYVPGVWGLCTRM